MIDADQIARDLMCPGQPVYEEVVRHFGRGILSPDDTIDRKKLADVAFGTPEYPSKRVEELNQIVHPAVAKYQNKWMNDVASEHPGAIILVEAALIYEANLQSDFDRMIVVTCPFETRVHRWMDRTHTDEATARAELERRAAAQWPEEKKVQAADYRIDNSGDPEKAARQVREIMDTLKITG